MNFRFFPLRFTFRAKDVVYFPRGKPGNLLRGAFGSIFRKIACVPECVNAECCPLLGECAYARLFAPSAMEAGPSGLVDLPRPFVFRATHLDGRTLKAGEVFSFDLNLFDLQSTAVAYFVVTFSQLAHQGIGPGRGRAVLEHVGLVDAKGAAAATLFDGTQFQEGALAVAEFRLDWEGPPVRRVAVRFETPTELKTGQQLARRPEFFILAGRLRDRASKLRELYGDGALDMDFKGFGERAAAVKMVRCEIEGVDMERRSSRTGQVHPIGGFVGEAEYEGDLGEFVPFLELGKWIGVGRQTVWGKGEIGVRVIG